MKLKKYLATTMAVVTAMMMAACGGSGNQNSQSNATSTGNTPTAESAQPTAGNTETATIESDSTSTKGNFTIGMLQFAPHPSLDNCREGFIEGLKQGGYIEGENLTIDHQNSQADMAMATQIANTFASKQYDLIGAIATPAAAAAFNEGSKKDIPVVFSAVSDPVAAELVKSIEQPDTGATGTRDVLPVEAQLQLIRALLPEAKTIGIMYTTSETNSISTLETYKELAPKYDFEIVEQGINSGNEVSMAADSMLAKVDCVTNMTDNTVVTNMQVILDKAAAKNIPVFGSEEEQVGNGCVGAMGIDYFELGVSTGKIAARVLDGEDIKGIAVEQFTQSTPFINKKVAEDLGITIPEDLADVTYLGE